MSQMPDRDKEMRNLLIAGVVFFGAMLILIIAAAVL